MHQLPDRYLTDVLPIAKKVAVAQGFENYNLLQNNGRIAHQVSLSLYASPYGIIIVSEADTMNSRFAGSSSCAFPRYSKAFGK